MKIYVPDITNYKCTYVYGEGVLRSYEKVPQANQTINYRDYYINNDYIFKDGSTTFTTYSTLPNCLSSDTLTTNFYYRNDIDKILVIFSILVIFCIYCPIKLFSRLLGGKH